MPGRIRDIEDHLERWDAQCKREAMIEAVRARRRLYRTVIKLNVGIIAILCAIYAIYLQF
jgi:hypothetical protein